MSLQTKFWVTIRIYAQHQR